MNNAGAMRQGANEIAGLIRQEITNGVLAPRERLTPERELANAYGVSRGTVREALNQLSSEGLVEIRRGSGTYVSVGTEAAVSANYRVDRLIADTRPLELIDARFALEPHLCRLAVLHARPGDLKTMEDMLGTMEKNVSDQIAYSNADKEFHKLLAKSTGNDLLVWMMLQIDDVRNQDEWLRMRHLTLTTDTMLTYNKQHRLIHDAIRAREPEQAASLMKEHLETARLSLTRAAET